MENIFDDVLARIFKTSKTVGMFGEESKIVQPSLVERQVAIEEAHKLNIPGPVIQYTIKR